MPSSRQRFGWPGVSFKAMISSQVAFQVSCIWQSSYDTDWSFECIFVLKMDEAGVERIDLTKGLARGWPQLLVIV